MAKADDVYKILPFSQKIDVDGKANEQIWKQLPYSEKFVLLKGKEKPKFSSRFKAFSDRENLYFLIELCGQDLKILQSKPSELNIKTHTFPGDQVLLYFAPRPEVDDHFCVMIDFYGHIEGGFIPAKAGHGFPYAPEVQWGQSLGIKCALQEADKAILMEIQIPVSTINLQKNLFKEFGFNLQRKAFYEEGKTKKSEDSSWSYVNGEIWNTEYFGTMQGPNYQAPINYTEKDLENLDQMTNGMTALMKSLDVYYKATIGYPHHIPEGTEINGDIGNFDHVPLPQYPVKADGYFRFYNATQYKPYKDLGNHIINKLYMAYKETKDASDRNYLLWNNLMSYDGVVYGYGAGYEMKFFHGGRVPYNQSKNKFFLKDVTYVDALGQGLIDLSEIKDTLDQDIREKLVEVLNGTFDFLHQPDMLVQTEDSFYWRIDAFEALNPKPFTGKLEKKDWPILGSDIILMFLAFYQFDQKSASLYIDSFTKFSKFYVKNRLAISEQWGPHYPQNIYKLDHRMLSLANFAKEKGLVQFDFLNQWLQDNLPKIYSEIPKVEYSVNGATKNSWSTQGVLEIYRLLGMKYKYRKFWQASFENNMKPLGLYIGHRIQPMNFSSYPMYFDYAQKANQMGMLSDIELKTTVKKMLLLYGNANLHRDNLKFTRDLTDEIRSRPMAANTPYPDYIEGILPEGIYANGSSQAFYSTFCSGKVNEFFKSVAESTRYEWEILYYQYTAPFQYHADRYSYGKAEALCLLEMRESQLKQAQLVKKENEFTIEITCKTPATIAGLPAFGALDITDILFQHETAKEPTDLVVDRVELEGQKQSFQSYQVLDYNRILSGKDKAKLVFGVWNKIPSKEIKVKVIFKKKNFHEYFANMEISK